uniref:Uncharacterized protein n=1 Tax=Oryza brachyantha TaxID=4533 RepID=J3MGM8_ORYBR
MKLTRARPAAQTSSSSTDSSGEWLTPPRHRTNSIPTLVSLAIAIASCPAPLISTGVSPPVWRPGGAAFID